MGTIISGGGIWPQAAAGGGGGGSITFTKVNRDGTKERRDEVTTDKIIPAGWAILDIVSMDLENPITINGKTIRPGGRWNSQDVIDWPANKQEFGGQVTINSGGKLYAFHVIYPTSSGVDVNTI
ncbi:MAG: hypothetical protein K1X68_13645 [Saprospiraceae bacterium]|nr:hypothetical protein [Saprospiraceae bacterium]HMW39295.1 hypothetical protein [Saprospiraceae bacterium]HMX89071.1 hypothetical protein [Saprospiraceae bacterium]HMZ40942.1 hypothetical protein [Saprospiraceae bacterium]HNC37638.1 hypothetical protein [Saprospiraceae bacterium]